MKNILIKKIIFILLMIFVNNTYAQRPFSNGNINGSNPIKYTKFNINELSINKTGDYSNGIRYGDQKEILINLFGNPNKIEDFYFEIDEVKGQIYTYNKNKFYIKNNKVILFQLFDNTFALTMKNNLQYIVNNRFSLPRNSQISIKHVSNNGEINNIKYNSIIENNLLLNNKNEIIDDVTFNVLMNNNLIVFIELGE